MVERRDLLLFSIYHDFIFIIIFYFFFYLSISILFLYSGQIVRQGYDHECVCCDCFVGDGTGQSKYTGNKRKYRLLFSYSQAIHHYSLSLFFQLMNNFPVERSDVNKQTDIQIRQMIDRLLDRSIDREGRERQRERDKQVSCPRFSLCCYNFTLVIFVFLFYSSSNIKMTSTRQ